MRRIDRVIPEAVQNDEVLLAARAQALFRDWPGIVGETLAKKSWPDRYSKGTVWVAVEGAAWASELRMRKTEILQRLRDRAENQAIFKDVRFGVRTLPREAMAEWAREPEPEVQLESTVESVVGLSIRDIAARRLSKWKNPEDTR